MRAILRTALLASAVSLVAAPTAFAQTKGEPADAGITQMKQVPLTQKQIDGVIATQKPIETIEAKQPQDVEKLDPKVEAELNEVVKKNGFAGLAEYSDVTSSIGIVMAGMDPRTKTYVGPGAVIKKQIAEVEADKSMPPKEKTEALAELKQAMSSAASANPMAQNIDLVAKNFDALAKTIEPGAK